MKNFLNSFLSLLTIILFLMFAVASGKPDGATNTTVPLDESKCKTEPMLSLNATISISFKDKVTGAPLAFFKGEIFYTVQRVTTTSPPCEYDINTRDNFSFTTDALGNYFYSSADYEMKNAADLFRIQVRLDETAVYHGDLIPARFLYYPSLSFSPVTLYGLRKSAL